VLRRDVNSRFGKTRIGDKSAKNSIPAPANLEAAQLPFIGGHRGVATRRAIFTQPDPAVTLFRFTRSRRREKWSREATVKRPCNRSLSPEVAGRGWKPGALTALYRAQCAIGRSCRAPFEIARLRYAAREPRSSSRHETALRFVQSPKPGNAFSRGSCDRISGPSRDRKRRRFLARAFALCRAQDK